jgi:NADPH:quinone reductase-like Zn-dependent oxidoreductase
MSLTPEMPATMQALRASSFALDGLALADVEVPLPRDGEVLLRLRAASLNYRDLAILTEGYLPQLSLPYVPCSDACGEVVALGAGVTRWRVGDRLLPIYTRGWHDGMPTPEMRARHTLGGPLDGVLQQYVAVPAEEAVAAPPSLSDAEAACLPIAALTAWSVLIEGGVKPGSTVLLQGTGGVSLFALQFAKAAGANVIITSSSEEKLARAKMLGADVGINYRSQPEWDRLVREVSDGRGADIVVETGGATLPTSLKAAAFGGFVGLVGFVAGYEATIGIRQMLGPMLRVQGIAVGSRARFEAMNRAIESRRLKPVIDSTFPLAEGAKAFRHMAAAAHFGKVVVTL